MYSSFSFGSSPGSNITTFLVFASSLTISAFPLTETFVENENGFFVSFSFFSSRAIVFFDFDRMTSATSFFILKTGISTEYPSILSGSNASCGSSNGPETINTPAAPMSFASRALSLSALKEINGLLLFSGSGSPRSIITHFPFTSTPS